MTSDDETGNRRVDVRSWSDMVSPMTSVSFFVLEGKRYYIKSIDIQGILCYNIHCNKL